MVGQLLLAVLRLGDDGRQLLLLRTVLKVSRVLIPPRRRLDSGQLRVIVLDHHPGFVL